MVICNTYSICHKNLQAYGIQSPCHVGTCVRESNNRLSNQSLLQYICICIHVDFFCVTWLTQVGSKRSYIHSIARQYSPLTVPILQWMQWAKVYISIALLLIQWGCITKWLIGQTDREQIRSRINNNDCRMFRPRRPLSTAYKTFVLRFVHSWQVKVVCACVCAQMKHNQYLCTYIHTYRYTHILPLT